MLWHLRVLQAIDVEDSEYVMKKLSPIFVGGAIGGIVLCAYLLFFLVSACCKCCSKNRGCCQKPQQKKYKQRIPFVAVIATVAILGAVGGIIVLSSGPKVVGIVDAFIKDTLALVRCPDSASLYVENRGHSLVQHLDHRSQVDSIIGDLEAITEMTIEGLGKADITNDSVDDLETSLAEVKQFREEELQGTLDAVDKVLRLINTIAMAVGGVLMAVALAGLFGAALLVCPSRFFASVSVTL